MKELLKAAFGKLNLIDVITDHLKTLKGYDPKDRDYAYYKSRGPRPVELIVFFLFPFIVAFMLTHYGIGLDKDTINVLITALSVVTALLFNLLLLVYDFIKKEGDSNSKISSEDSKDHLVNRNNALRLKMRYLNEIYSNISFSILVAVITVVILVVLLMNVRYPKEMTDLNFRVAYFCNLFTFALLCNFVLTLIMILQRIHKLLTDEFKGQYDKLS